MVLTGANFWLEHCMHQELTSKGVYVNHHVVCLQHTCMDTHFSIFSHFPIVLNQPIEKLSALHFLHLVLEWRSRDRPHGGQVFLNLWSGLPRWKRSMWRKVVEKSSWHTLCTVLQLYRDGCCYTSHNLCWYDIRGSQDKRCQQRRAQSNKVMCTLYNTARWMEWS